MKPKFEIGQTVLVKGLSSPSKIKTVVTHQNQLLLPEYVLEGVEDVISEENIEPYILYDDMGNYFVEGR